MTIEDRVDDIGDWRDPDARNHAIRVMRAAIEEEREACARIAEENGGNGEWYIQVFADNVAEEIRARSNASGHSAAPAEK